MPGEILTLPPSEQEQIRELHRMLKVGTPALVGSGNERIEIPQSIYDVLKSVVGYMVRGHAITLVPQKQQLTTQSAANLLGFSRPHLVKLLEAGKIPFERVGQHRRVLLKDVLDFQKNRDTERREAMRELSRSEYKSGAYEGIPIPEGGSDE